jgi:Squalene-hopene cyclase C-terminal domain/Prenyltransferase and squalene oxidase repeat
VSRVLARLLASQGTTLTDMVAEALAYFLRCQLPNGSVAEDPDTLVICNWDTVNVLKAIARWRPVIGFDDRGAADRLLEYLRSCEEPGGMIHPGFTEPGRGVYCTETTSEYVAALAFLGQVDLARAKALTLRERQLRTGAWHLIDPRVPAGFHAFPPVTAFALLAMRSADVDPRLPDEALGFLVQSQKSSGHFGINRFWYNTPYYPIRPIVAVLAGFGYHSSVAAARDFVCAQQASDGGWPGVDEEFGCALSADLFTALALETLGHAGWSADHRTVRHGLLWLCSRQRPDGSWYGGRYPYPVGDGYPDLRARQDVYTTAQVLSTLHHFASMEGM